MSYKRKHPDKTISELNKVASSMRKTFVTHQFTEEERSRGGTTAREIERSAGKKLNHGITYGKRDGN